MVAAVVRDLCMGLVAYSVPFIGAAVYFASVRPFMRRIARWAGAPSVKCAFYLPASTPTLPRRSVAAQALPLHRMWVEDDGLSQSYPPYPTPPHPTPGRSVAAQALPLHRVWIEQNTGVLLPVPKARSVPKELLEGEVLL